MSHSKFSQVLLVELLKYTREATHLSEEEKIAILSKLPTVFHERFAQKIGDRLSRDITSADFNIEEYLTVSLAPELDHSEVEVSEKRQQVPSKCSKIMKDIILSQTFRKELSEEQQVQTPISDIPHKDEARNAEISSKFCQQTKVLDGLLGKVDFLVAQSEESK